MLVLNQPPLANVSIALLTTDGSATGHGESTLCLILCILMLLIGENQDYDFGHHIETFIVGIPSVSFSISITDDNILEKNENFTIGISLLPINVIVGDISHTTVTIVNDDGNTLCTLMNYKLKTLK